VVPVAFDVEVRGVVPPSLEEHEVHTSRSRLRVDAEVVRFHQTGVASGWVEVDGARVEVEPASWVGARDRSWGVRYGVGLPLEDLEPAPVPPGTAGVVLWMPATMRSERGPYGLFVYYQRYAGAGWSTGSAQGRLERPSGKQVPFAEIVPELRVDDANRRFLGGTLGVTMADGSQRELTIEPVSDTGFHLGAGLYHGFDGHWHGEWRGELHVDGEHLERCDDPAVARRVHQHRDCVVRVVDGATGDEGYGTLQSIVTGPHPAWGLTDEASFL